MKKILNLVFWFIGFLAVGLGTVGIILPILPTTPFYLLACFCFEKVHHSFISGLQARSYIRNIWRSL